MGEPPGELAGRHRAPARLEYLQDVPAGRMGECVEDLL
jgi:hypothetical protein